MTELNDEYIGAAHMVAKLVADPTGWINRRVETVEMLTHEETRRRVSIDFTLSDKEFDALRTRHGCAVPISVLSKQPRRNFDLKDESGQSVPVLGRADNADLSLVAVVSSILEAVPDDTSEDALELLAADAYRVVSGAGDDGRDGLAPFVLSESAGDDLRRAVWDDPKCNALLTTLANDYVLFAVIPPQGPNRRILKYSYGDDFNPQENLPLRRRFGPGELAWRIVHPDAPRFFIDCPGAGRGASFHAEVAIPEELRVREAVVAKITPSATAVAVGSWDRNVNRASLYASQSLSVEDDIRLYVEVVAERQGAATQSVATAATVSGLIWVGWIAGLDSQSNPDAAVSLLLAGAAIVSSYVAAASEHAIVNRVFRARRRLLALNALAALSASTSFAFGFPESPPTTVWLVAAILSSVVALRLLWSAIRAAR